MRRTWRSGAKRVALADAFPEDLRQRAVVTVVLAAAVATGQYVLDPGGATVLGQVQSILIDWMLCVPLMAVAVWLSERLLDGFGERGRSRVVHAAAVSLVGVPLTAPLFAARGTVQEILGLTAGHVHGAGSVGVASVASDAVRQALTMQPLVFVAAFLALGAIAYRARRAEEAPRRGAIRRGFAMAGVTVLSMALVAPPPFMDSVPGVGGSAAQAAPGSCATAPTRNYDVAAINVDITVNRFGDHDPFGFMYVLIDKEDDVRAQEAALQAAARDTTGTGAKVSTGLGTDPIQPLVLRATLGTCLVVNLTNKLTAPPRGGNALVVAGNPPVITQAGGIPSVSIDIQGVSSDITGGAGGESVGNNPAAVMVAPGATRTYRFYVDPAIGEGSRTFRSGGESTQLTAHGLFGTLVIEPAGSRWFDPRTGQERTGDVNWNSWEAMVQPPSGPTFREFTIAYHEIGDENFSMRRPQRETGQPGVTADPDGNGSPLPMVDEQPITTVGATTDSYRPGRRALNYRSEPFYRRLRLMVGLGRTEAQVEASESLGYSSYIFGDPATPIPRSYLGEPTKTRLVHPGFEELHVHHLHGGGDRWRQNPAADNTDIAGGLKKVPIQNAKSIRLDSQTVGPSETFNLEHECGAGGCQQAAGDFLYHCHIAQHYIAGMWAFWRVFDTRQSDLATLPNRTASPVAVNSAGLLGRTIEGRTVVLQSALTNPATQVALEALVENQLPPQGVRLDAEDATVWDWTKGGTATAPVYFGEPEDATVWPNYASPTPGAKPEILFNPNNGRYAWPLMRPHLGQRPPFSPNGHTGAPWLGNTTSSTRPDGLCPSAAAVRTYNITAISKAIQNTIRETDPDGMLYVLNEDRAAVLGGTKAPEPLAIRSNVGDCVTGVFSSELNAAVQQKVNMHTHFVQFDPQASDGVITGMSYEQSIYSDTREARTVSTATAIGATTVEVTNTTRLRPGIFIGIGVGRPNVEVAKIASISGNVLTLAAALTKAHPVGDPATVEFMQYRWFSDVDSGTVFWHDHVNGIKSWAHGMFAAHIIEPPGSTYHDPQTGAVVRSGTIVDIRTSGSVGSGQSGSFREFMLFLANGRQGRPELDNPAFFGVLGMNRNFGQECEEGSINYKAVPIGERTPGGATPADPATTQQRQEFDGQVCRTTTSNINDGTGNNTVNALVTTVDPYVFSSVKYGDPMTPLLRAYAGDPVVIRTIGLAERAEALRFQGHRFRQERFNADGQLVDTATTGISERFDYVLDGGAGGPKRMAGDYLYYSARNQAFETGAWGIFRVHDRLRTDLQPLPSRTPASGTGFPLLTAATGNTQQTPGPNPPAPTATNVSSSANPCPTGAPIRAYDVSLINVTLPSEPFTDNNGVVYALTSDVPAIVAGTKRVEPLVLRANQGDCVQVTLRNATTASSLYGGTRAGFDQSNILFNPQTSGGGAIGLNPDTTVPIGGSTLYRFFADKHLGTSLFRNVGSVASQRHGAYGMLIVEPAGATYFNSSNNSPLTATATSTQAIIRLPNGIKFREFALTMQTTDQHLGRSIVPYQDVVAGAGVNSTFTTQGANPPVADKGFNTVNYSTEPITVRLGLTTSPPNPSPNYAQAFSSAGFGDPSTPLLRAYAGDPVVIRVGIGASDQFHMFNITGHVFPREPLMWNGTTDKRSSLITSRTVTGGETIDAILVGGAGGSDAQPGDYMYRDARQQFAAAGMWGIFRVVNSATTLSDLARL